MIHLRIIAALVCGFLLSGCAEAIFSRVTRRDSAAYSDADFTRYAKLRKMGTTGKGEVLSTLGPPVQVLAQDHGDVFVYRATSRVTDVINLNPSTVSGFGPTVPVPLYFSSDTTGREDTLMLFFDTEGRLVGESLARGIDASQDGVLP